MTAVADADARAEIAAALDATLFVEAGAGTGKTHELVGRVVALVGQGNDIRRLAVITFTEAAAAELRERIRQRLATVARDETGERAQRAAEAIAVIDDAAITTLHGFSQRVLSEFSVDAGLPPGFEVLDEVEAEIAFDERWARWCDRMFDDPSLADAITVCSVLGIGMRQLERVARELTASWDLARDWAPEPDVVPTFDPAPVLATVDAAVALASNCSDSDDRLLIRLAEVAELAEHVRGAIDELEALELLTSDCNLGGKNKGKKENWNGAKPEVLEQLDLAERARVAAVERVQQPAVVTLLASVAAFVRDSAEARRREGRVVFHDLLVLARDVAQDVTAVRERLHDRYPYLLLDEFQDTDPIQIELAMLIAGGPNAADTPWWEINTAPGRIFTVGDPKQSIYRFRRADIELFSRARTVLGDGGRRHALTTNFRSRPGILEFVNEVFEPLMPTDTPLQPAYHPLQPDREPCASAPDPVQTFGGLADRKADLDELRRTEARELATLVRRMRDERWQVRERDGDGTTTRDARFSDIAILLPTRVTLNYLEEALDELDIPTRIESQSLVFATNAVQELLHVLQAIDDPVDEVAIVAALRAPAFACSDDLLVEFSRAGGSWDYRADPPEGLAPGHPVVDGMQALRALHERRAWESVSELVERVIRDRRLLELAVEHRRPRDHWRRIRFIADAARAFADRGGTSLRGFVAWAWSQADEEARAVEVIVPEPDDDAVRVLTVHGSKGLEFPIVMLTGLGLNQSPRTGAVIFGPDGPEIRLGYPKRAQFLSTGFDACKDHEHEAWWAEQLRLLYVALTRAEDHLVVSLHRRDREKCLAMHLAEAAASRPQLVPGVVAKPAAPAAPDAAVPTVDRDAWKETRESRIAALRRAPVLAATAIAKAATDDSENEAAETPPWRRGRAGSALGRAVHAVLQTIDLDTGDGIEATARAQALAEGLAGREGEIRELARSVLAAPTVRAAALAEHWREVPVAAPIPSAGAGDVLVEGFIDLLYRSDDGLVVVDYKTDHAPTDAAVDAAVDRYTRQGAAYALALEAALGQSVARCVFVFARPEGAVERDVVDLPRAVAAVREQLAASTSGDPA